MNAGVQRGLKLALKLAGDQTRHLTWEQRLDLRETMRWIDRQLEIDGRRRVKRGKYRGGMR